jgi:anti-sigma-K factor RskA
MMRCVQCDRDYPEPQAFCHQCGEPLLPTATTSTPAPLEKRPAARERLDDPSGQRRARAISRHGAPRRSQSLLFASVVVLGALAGLALVWRQAWMPSFPRITVSLSRELGPPPAVNSTPAPVAAVPAAPPPSAAPAAPTASASPQPEPAFPTANSAPTAAPSPAPAPAAPAPVTTRAPEPVAAAPAPAPPRRNPEPAPAPPKVASRPEPAAPPAVDRPAPPKLLSARTDPGTSLPASGTRVIPLVPVGPATGARGQLLWEPMGGGTLVVSGLPQLPAGRTYQLWLGSINLGNRVSAGLLAVDAQGMGTLRVAPPRATWSPDIFGITMERQGGAREPSDDLVLVGELSKTIRSAPPATAMAATPSPSMSAATPERATPPSLSSSDTASSAAPPTVTASIPPPGTASRGSEGQLVRVFPASAERSFTVAQSVLRSLGWDIDQANLATGVIRTEPRNVTFKDFVVYGEGTRHILDVVVRPVSGSETSVSVKRRVFTEQRIFWAKERKDLPAPESAVEHTVLDAISRLL